MSERGSFERFERVPGLLVVSGEGLADMHLDDLNQLAEAMAGAGIEIRGADEIDVPVLFDSFAEAGAEQDMPHMATRTWNALMRARSEGRQEPGRFPDYMYINPYALSYNGLNRALRTGSIKNVAGLGRRGEDLVGVVVEAVDFDKVLNISDR